MIRLILASLVLLSCLHSTQINWEIPAGLNLVAAPATGGLTEVLQGQLTRLDRVWTLSNSSRRWQTFSATDSTSFSSSPWMEQFLAHNGYVTNASAAIQVSVSSASFPQISPTTGFQLLPLLDWGTSPRPVSEVAVELSLARTVSAIFTLHNGKWLGYFHQPSTTVSQLRNELTSLEALTEVTAGRAYFLSYVPLNTQFNLRPYQSEHALLQSPVITIGNIAARIQNIVNQTAIIVPANSTDSFIFSTWPESLNLRLMENQPELNLTSTFEFHLLDQTAPATHYASATANQFLLTVAPGGQTTATMTLDAGIQGLVFVPGLSIEGQPTASGNGNNSTLDPGDGHAASYPVLGFAISDYVDKLRAFSFVAQYLPGFEQILLTVQFATPGAVFSVHGSSQTFNRFEIRNFKIQP